VEQLEQAEFFNPACPNTLLLSLCQKLFSKIYLKKAKLIKETSILPDNH